METELVAPILDEISFSEAKPNLKKRAKHFGFSKWQEKYLSASRMDKQSLA